MNIHDIGHGVHRTGPHPRNVHAKTNSDESAPSTAPTVNPTETQSSSKGALGLIESGHFKGVADVRLRINFHDQLSARATAAALPAVQAESDELAATVSSEFDAIVNARDVDDDTRAALDEFRDAFAAAVEAAADDVTAYGELDTDALSTALQSAFDQLTQEVQSLLNPAPTQAPTDSPPLFTPPDFDVVPLADEGETEVGETDDGAVATPPGETTTTDNIPTLDEALASLQSVFEAALTGLLDSLAAVVQPAALSPPSGNGVAYEKFLSTYNALRYPSTPEAPTNLKPIDVAG